MEVFRKIIAVLAIVFVPLVMLMIVNDYDLRWPSAFFVISIALFFSIDTYVATFKNKE